MSHSVHEYDCFLSHDWGEDHKNHAEVEKVSAELKRLGFKPWFDSDDMKGDIASAMANGMDASNIVLIFITQRYLAKVNSTNVSDNCFKEFRYTFAQKKKYILVLMDPRVRPADMNSGVVGMHVADTLYVNMSKGLRMDELVKEMQINGVVPRKAEVNTQTTLTFELLFKQAPSPPFVVEYPFLDIPQHPSPLP